MTSVGFMLATPQIIIRETRGKQAGNSTNGGQGRNLTLPPFFSLSANEVGGEGVDGGVKLRQAAWAIRYEV